MINALNLDDDLYQIVKKVHCFNFFLCLYFNIIKNERFDFSSLKNRKKLYLKHLLIFGTLSDTNLGADPPTPPLVAQRQNMSKCLFCT